MVLLPYSSNSEKIEVTGTFREVYSEKLKVVIIFTIREYEMKEYIVHIRRI
jgi:hypothetical protein